MTDRGLVYVLPDKVWFYCRYTGPLVIESLAGIDEDHDIGDVDKMLRPYYERVGDFITSYSRFLCRMVEIDFEKETVILKDEPASLKDPYRKVRWEGSFAEFSDYHNHIERIWDGMFSG